MAMLSHTPAGQAFGSTISRTYLEGGMLYAVADIACQGEQRCKIALSLGQATGSEAMELVKAKCLAWIEQADTGLDTEEPLMLR